MAQANKRSYWMTETAVGKHKRLVTLIHVAKSKLLLDNETYRLLLEEETGKSSTKLMQVWELEKVMKRLKSSGFKVRKPLVSKRAQAADPQAQKIRALWLELHESGLVRDPSESAMCRYVERQTKVEALQWLNPHQASKVIEALKQWLQRKQS
jgi:phage gp16-like protein